MPGTLVPFRFLCIAVEGWMNQERQHTIAYPREENRILRAHLGFRRLRRVAGPGDRQPGPNSRILFGEEAFRTAVREFVYHYHRERNHQGIGNVLVASENQMIYKVTSTGPLIGLVSLYDPDRRWCQRCALHLRSQRASEQLCLPRLNAELRVAPAVRVPWCARNKCLRR